MSLDEAVAELARAYRIDTEFWDWKGRRVEVPRGTIVAALAAMDVDASTPEAAREALAAFEARPWTRMLPSFVVMEQGRGRTVDVHVPVGSALSTVVSVRLEDGGEWQLSQADNWDPDREVDGVLKARMSYWLPDNLPLGYHRIQATAEAVTAETTLLVSPHFLGLPPQLGDRRVWGYGLQLYSVHGQNSWEIGDLRDLRDLAVWSATQQNADYLLINPLHAAQPEPPTEPSPYLPTSRRYVNPLYIRVEAIMEYALLSEEDRREIRRIKDALHRRLTGSPLIQRDPILSAKLEALRIVYEAGLPPASQMAKQEFARREGRGLTQFATWCALATEYGPQWRGWPAELQRPSSPAVSAWAAEHADEVDFYIWMQWIADQQLRRAQSSARDTGMAIGIVHDLAVGVSPDSAEAWSFPDVFAPGVSVGAPPDPFNQFGQDWGQMPWRPDRLEELSYAPFRTMVSGILRHAGGLRVDHVMGLFRLWWVPEGAKPHEGTYVRFNHEAMVGILVLEAYRTGALVVGEDLGTVEPWVRDYLRDRGILGTSILWFEEDAAGPRDPGAWRDYCMASVTTHDLPPTAGYLALDHVRLRSELGLLTESLDHELEIARADLQRWIDKLAQLGLLPGDDALDPTENLVLALHRYLHMTPARVLCVALTDAVGERRTQNQPGTVDEYPNWRVPLGGPGGEPLLLEDLFLAERPMRMSALMNRFRNVPQPFRPFVPEAKRKKKSRKPIWGLFG
ncbi:4-alpha-glucanotransferase [Propionicicella superfundia]|uniref:4-alpha-glucanotransferase n=1 Tax=Propionicicella superfundia TaxID=348582 RepID=UPI000423D6BD|nr:4-alpha-glucanotransferase [Propionicicella superfundia]